MKTKISIFQGIELLQHNNGLGWNSKRLPPPPLSKARPCLSYTPCSDHTFSHRLLGLKGNSCLRHALVQDTTPVRTALFSHRAGR